MVLRETLECIEDLDEKLVDKAKKRLDSLTKPLGSLGKLEKLVQQIVGIRGQLFPNVHKKTVIIMCADNGVVRKSQLVS